MREREAFTPEQMVTYVSTRVDSRVSLLPRAARIWWSHPIGPFSVKSRQEIAGYHHTLHQSSNIRGRAPQYAGLLCWEAPLYPFPARIPLHVHDYSTASSCKCTVWRPGMLRGSLVPPPCAHAITCTPPLLPTRAAKLLLQGVSGPNRCGSLHPKGRSDGLFRVE